MKQNGWVFFQDKLLPNGSYVMMSGLADGRVLYNSLHDRIHPIGRLNNDVTYPDVYNYLNCLEVVFTFSYVCFSYNRTLLLLT